MTKLDFKIDSVEQKEDGLILVRLSATHNCDEGVQVRDVPPTPTSGWRFWSPELAFALIGLGLGLLSHC